MLYYSCVDVLSIAIDFSSLTFHCIFSLFGVRSVMPYYNKMMMMMMMMMMMDRRPAVRLPRFGVATADTAISRPVRLSADWLPHRGHHLSDEYGHQPIYHRTIRHRPIVRFFESF